MWIDTKIYFDFKPCLNNIFHYKAYLKHKKKQHFPLKNRNFWAYVFQNGLQKFLGQLVGP